MKKTIAIVGSAAALSFAGSGLAAAQDEVPTPDTGTNGTTAETTDGEGQVNDDDEGDDGESTDPETPAEVSSIAQQLCGSISAYDFLGSAAGVAPALSGEECEANADEAVEAAMSGDISGAMDILRGIDSELGDASGSAELADSLADDAAEDGEADAADPAGADADGAAEVDNVDTDNVDTDNVEVETLTGAGA